jgi:hypothetical protein
VKCGAVVTVAQLASLRFAGKRAYDECMKNTQKKESLLNVLDVQQS